MYRCLLIALVIATVLFSFGERGRAYAREFQIDSPGGEHTPGDPWGGIGGNGCDSDLASGIKGLQLAVNTTTALATATVYWGPIPNPFAIVSLASERARVVLHIAEQRSARRK